MKISNLFYKNLFVVLVGVISILFSSWSVLRADFFRPHDYTHAARIIEMQRSLQSGEFPVRWSQNFGFGYGMPLFNFYAPFPYYVAQVPLVFTDVITSIKFLYVLNGILSFIGMFLLAKEIWNEKGGLISATVFIFATYRAVDLFVRGAIGEAYALAFLPFALLGIIKIIKNKKWGVILTSISLGFILLSHNLIGMVSLPILLAFGVFLFIGTSSLKTVKSLQPLLWLIGSLLFAIALSSFYVLPAFVEKSETRVEEAITTGDFDFHNHFIYLRQLVNGKWGFGGSIPGPEDGLSFALGLTTIIGVVSGGLIGWIKGSKNQRVNLLLCLGFFGAVTLLTTHKTTVIWEHISLLKFMQFPWRFLTFSHVFGSLIAGGVGILIHDKIKSSLMVGLLGILIMILSLSLFVPEKFISDLSPYYRTDPEFISQTLSKTLNDYLPPSIPVSQFISPVRERVTAIDSTAKIVITESKSTFIKANASCEKECEIQVNLFVFPDWVAVVNGQHHDLTKKSDFPIYTLSLPSGNHDVVIMFRDTLVRRIANMISLFAWGGIGVFIFIQKRSKLL